MATSPCLSHYRIDRHFLGLENKKEELETKTHLKTCALCQKDYQTVSQAYEQFRPESVQIPRMSWFHSIFEELRRLFSVPVVNIAYAGAFAFLLVFSVVKYKETSTKQIFSTIRGHKKPKLLIVLKRNSQIQRITSGTKVSEGDFIRIGYRWSKSGYMFVVHQDKKGNISPIYPKETNQQSQKVEKTSEAFFEGSLEVDGEPNGDEILWACFSDKPHPFSAVQQQVAGQKQVQRKQQTKAVCTHLIRFVLKREST